MYADAKNYFFFHFLLGRILEVFISFRLDIVVKRTKFDLAKAEARAHILEGLKIALKNIDKIVEFPKYFDNEFIDSDCHNYLREFIPQHP